MASLEKFDSHVNAWERWWLLEGRHFDNSLRHPDYQIQTPPVNAQGMSSRFGFFSKTFATPEPCSRSPKLNSHRNPARALSNLSEPSKQYEVNQGKLPSAGKNARTR